jgi:hypothetical protein
MGPMPGIYKVDIEAYHKSPEWAFAYSSSDLDAVRLSPANIIAKRALPIDMDALRLGRAVHARLEFYNNDDAYLKMILAEPKCDKRTTAGKEKFAKWEQELALADTSGKIVLSQKEWDEVEAMKEQLMAHPEAKHLLEAPGIAEETFIWQDADTGVWCKCRPDKRLTSGPSDLFINMPIDWKTVKPFDGLRDLSYEAENRNYHTKAAFIYDGIRTVLEKDPGPFCNVFIEKGGFRKVVCALMPDADLERGRQQYKEDLARIAHSLKSGIWGGFVDLSLPNRGAA